MKTKNVKLGVIAVALLSGVMPLKVKAQDKAEAKVGADLVSSYIWRGSNCGGVSFQPNMKSHSKASMVPVNTITGH